MSETGTMMAFNEEARACFVARLLAREGWGVLWDPADKPTVVATSCGCAEVRRLSDANKGTADEWWRAEKIDTDTRRKRDG